MRTRLASIGFVVVAGCVAKPGPPSGEAGVSAAYRAFIDARRHLRTVVDGYFLSTERFFGGVSHGNRLSSLWFGTKNVTLDHFCLLAQTTSIAVARADMTRTGWNGQSTTASFIVVLTGNATNSWLVAGENPLPDRLGPLLEGSRAGISDGAAEMKSRYEAFARGSRLEAPLPDPGAGLAIKVSPSRDARIVLPQADGYDATWSVDVEEFEALGQVGSTVIASAKCCGGWKSGMPSAGPIPGFTRFRDIVFLSRNAAGGWDVQDRLNY